MLLEENANYEITVGAGEYWCDDNTRCSADGWRVDDEKFDASPPPFEFCTSTIKMVKMQVTTINTVNTINI